MSATDDEQTKERVNAAPQLTNQNEEAKEKAMGLEENGQATAEVKAASTHDDDDHHKMEIGKKSGKEEKAESSQHNNYSEENEARAERRISEESPVPSGSAARTSENPSDSEGKRKTTVYDDQHVQKEATPSPSSPSNNAQTTETDENKTTDGNALPPPPLAVGVHVELEGRPDAKEEPLGTTTPTVEEEEDKEKETKPIASPTAVHDENHSSHADNHGANSKNNKIDENNNISGSDNNNVGEEAKTATTASQGDQSSSVVVEEKKRVPSSKDISTKEEEKDTSNKNKPSSDGDIPSLAPERDDEEDDNTKGKEGEGDGKRGSLNAKHEEGPNVAPQKQHVVSEDHSKALDAQHSSKHQGILNEEQRRGEGTSSADPHAHGVDELNHAPNERKEGSAEVSASASAGRENEAHGKSVGSERKGGGEAASSSSSGEKKLMPLLNRTPSRGTTDHHGGRSSSASGHQSHQRRSHSASLNASGSGGHAANVSAISDASYARLMMNYSRSSGRSSASPSPLPPIHRLTPAQQEKSVQHLYTESIARRQRTLESLEKQHHKSMIAYGNRVLSEEETSCMTKRLFTDSVAYKQKSLEQRTQKAVDRQRQQAGCGKRFESPEKEKSTIRRLYDTIAKDREISQKLFEKHNPPQKRVVRSPERLSENDKRFYEGQFGKHD